MESNHAVGRLTDIRNYNDIMSNNAYDININILLFITARIKRVIKSVNNLNDECTTSFTSN